MCFSYFSSARKSVFIDLVREAMRSQTARWWKWVFLYIMQGGHHSIEAEMTSGDNMGGMSVELGHISIPTALRTGI
jgi:hypothetical protein